MALLFSLIFLFFYVIAAAFKDLRTKSKIRKQNKVRVTISRDLSEVDCMNGHDFEYWCAAVLKANGFYNVSVTKGSGDQGVDVLASLNGQSYAIQCKCYAKNVGNKPVQEVCAGKQYYNCDIGVVMTNRYFTKGAQELAQRTGVILWNREDIWRMLNNCFNK